MTRKEIIDGLKMTMGLITFDPSTGEDIDPDDLNDLNRTTYDACKCAVELLESQDVTLHMNLPEVSVEEAVEILKRNNRIELIPSGEDTNVPSNDTISRQAAIELAMQYCPDDDGTCSKADEDIRNLLDELEDMPPAQPERKKGKWIVCGDKHVCSECDEFSLCDAYDVLETGEYQEKLSDFCPNCGADMRGEQT